MRDFSERKARRGAHRVVAPRVEGRLEHDRIHARMVIDHHAHDGSDLIEIDIPCDRHHR